MFPKFPKRSLPHFLIATFIPYKCSLCRVGPSVNTFEGTTNFSFQTQFFEIWVLEQNPLKKKFNIFLTLALKIVK
jgi:hypothetical protein